MSENGSKNKKIMVCITIVVSYLVIYAISRANRNAIETCTWGDWSHIIKSDIKNLVVMAIIMLIPFEKIAFAWESLSEHMHIGDKAFSKTQGMFIGACALYGGFVAICYWLQNVFSYEFLRIDRRDTMCLLISLMVVFIMACTFDMFKSNISLLLFDSTLIIANAVVVFSLSYEFLAAFITTVGLSIAFNVCNFLSKRNCKIATLVGSVLINCFALYLAIVLSGRSKELYAWLEPYKHMNWGMSEEHIALKGHTLILENDLPAFAFRHPFSSIFSNLGAGALIIFFVACIAIGVAVVKSSKYLSKRRYNVLITLFIMQATLFVYTLMADLGFAPTASVVLLYSRIQIILIGVAIRLFINKKEA